MWHTYRNWHVFTGGIWAQWNGSAFVVLYRVDNVIYTYRTLDGVAEFSRDQLDRIINKVTRLQSAGIGIAA